MPILGAGRRLIVGLVAIAWIIVVYTVLPGAGQGLEVMLNRLEGPPCSVRIDETGRRILLTGDLSYGVSEDVQGVLEGFDSIRYIELDGPGGLVREGVAIAHLVRERGLVTVVRARCNSACVDILAAGRERWITDAARVGLHTWSEAGVAVDAADEESERIYQASGIDLARIREWEQTAPWDVTTPPVEALLAARLVTRVVKEGELAQLLKAAPDALSGAARDIEISGQQSYGDSLDDAGRTRVLRSTP
jgi:hypothetical protein